MITTGPFGPLSHFLLARSPSAAVVHQSFCTVRDILESRSSFVCVHVCVVLGFKFLIWFVGEG